MTNNNDKQNPPISYAKSHFDKLASSLKQNMHRRKQANKNQSNAIDEKQNQQNNDTSIN